ncbi:hypothetical protein PVAP13_2KG536400 [Panicum virgatum]|uniref:Uncharacterized protein n=1 Tax=Panicum virgatum TaxID=38727 RepID=A0A8T0WPK2_PANVG|nr:hypothetical protein PVAP13_2KG536400 [Panicum virgatum]
MMMQQHRISSLTLRFNSRQRNGHACIRSSTPFRSASARSEPPPISTAVPNDIPLRIVSSPTIPSSRSIAAAPPRPWARMGLPLEPRCVVDVGEEPVPAIGCRTPPRRQQEGGVAGGGDEDARVLVVCPPAPRKKPRPAAPAAVVARRTAAELYTGADLEAFFAARNV